MCPPQELGYVAFAGLLQEPDGLLNAFLAAFLAAFLHCLLTLELQQQRCASHDSSLHGDQYRHDRRHVLAQQVRVVPDYLRYAIPAPDHGNHQQEDYRYRELIDEWVAYARQLHDQGELPAGSFETQFTFAQTLTESARAAGNCLLVVSLPASETGGSPHALTDDAEVGGQRGREALSRLSNAIGRIDTAWRPATAEESFEIVRRRLFQPFQAAQFRARDVVAREFAELYRTQQQEFPKECREAGYEQRLKAAYPIHPPRNTRTASPTRCGAPSPKTAAPSTSPTTPSNTSESTPLPAPAQVAVYWRRNKYADRAS